MAIPKNIHKEHLQKAIEKIDIEGIPTDGASQYYDVIYNNKSYPPKVVVSYANIYANGYELNRNTFSDGLDTECFSLLNENGFVIQRKSISYYLLGAAWYGREAGHWLGLDVHDVGDYTVGDEWRVLEPGMVVTVEPGIYIPAGTKGVPKRWWNIGVRIEDDVLVTPDGCELLTAGLPRTTAEIERVMAA